MIKKKSTTQLKEDLIGQGFEIFDYANISEPSGNDGEVRGIAIYNVPTLKWQIV